MPVWVMDPLTGNMMQRGVGAAQQVVRGHLGDVDTLTREAGQNSLDQRVSEKGTVKVRYTLIELSGKHKSDFLKSMDWPGLQNHLQACTNDPGATGPRLRRGCNAIESNEPLRCLRIEDFGTRGLEGDDVSPEDRNKNFQLLCRAEFKTSNEGGRGGSHGLGKAVLWGASGIATVLVSSIVHGWESKSVRIFGRTDIPSHSIPGGGDYQSGGWFGTRKGKKTDSTEYAESVFGNKDLAKSLHLDRASSRAGGTSVLIVGFYEPDQDELRKLTEIAEDILASATRWFWPSMVGKTPAMAVEVSIEKNGAEIFTKKANALPTWEPFIRASGGAATGAAAKLADEVAESPIPFKVPARELPQKLAHAEFGTELKLRVTRGEESLGNHEKANCIAVFRGSTRMVVRYVQVRKPLDNQPLFGVLMAGKAVGSSSEDSKAEEFFRVAEPPLHDEWKYTEGLKNEYKQGAKQRLFTLWSSLQEKVFALIDEKVTPQERGPELLAKLFPFGQSQRPSVAKHAVRTEITKTSYLGGKWKVEGEVKRLKVDNKSWEARIGFVAATDSGAGEYLTVTHLTTDDNRAKLKASGPPAIVTASGAIDSFAFEAVLDPPASLRKKDLDLTAIRFSH
jgi:hypothetical protein